MLTFIELLIGVVVIVGVARYIIKGYSATGVLFVGGLLLLIISAIMGHKVLPSSQASTGYSATDIVEYVKILLMSRGGDLGMMIMMLCGFAAYMTISARMIWWSSWRQNHCSILTPLTF